MRKSTSRRRKRFFLILFSCVSLPLVALVFAWLLTLPDVAELESHNPETTALIKSRQRQAEEKGRRIGLHWTWVPLSRISPHLRHAVVAAEDASFFGHDGFDWEGIKDAALYNLEKGEFKRGASTITQQLAKNLYLSTERSIFRKVHEALITSSLEHHLSKERILEIYLNVAEWGFGVYGAEAASRHHFKKPASDLTPDEAAWLAAILPSPRRYDPLRKTSALAKRHGRILRSMVQYSNHRKIDTAR
jgi:monofunctional biosynthetic peptidoglycan transglycosylase